MAELECRCLQDVESYLVSMGAFLVLLAAAVLYRRRLLGSVRVMEAEAEKALRAFSGRFRMGSEDLEFIQVCLQTEAMRPSSLAGLMQKLRCPACGAALEEPCEPGCFCCSGCGTSYPVLGDGVPVLLVPAQRSRFQNILNQDEGGRRMAAEYRRHGTWRARLRGLLRPPSIVYDADTARLFSWIYDTRGAETVVLSIGGGPGRENPRAVNLNVDAFESVDIVGDGGNIPLADASVDTVTCNAVIEHVPDPARVVSEMHRVLKPGGYAQLMIPFVFPYHAYPDDYQRYSRSGILELTRAFEPVELSVLTGPTSTLLVLFREYLRLLIPGGNRPLPRLLLNGLSGWLTFPMKYLDKPLNRKPDSAIMAAAFYFLGRKK